MVLKRFPVSTRFYCDLVFVGWRVRAEGDDVEFSSISQPTVASLLLLELTFKGGNADPLRRVTLPLWFVDC